ncbi:RagB/SusD family nutrient uptake outer membrane protein [Marinoscillum sp.]|uniref:RagB/SusD family nutrient uptake outer membrane protein n=1 Tax=Marinoscillum sp. TaxID=2024838 RepID=UPI003BA8EDC4
MKKYTLTITSFILLSLLTVSCFDLSESVYSEIPVDNFFNSEKDVIAYAGRAYVKLQPYPEEQRLWSLGQNASDEMVIPQKHNGEWYDQGRWEEIQKHTLNSATSGNKILTKSWDMVFEGITACNEILFVIDPIEFENKDRVIAEIKILRAFYYYWAMDYWGNIPFSIDFSEKDPPQQKDRAFVFDFIVQEILDNVDAVQDLPTAEYYGRVTKGMAYTFLAKMYLNAQEWIGQNKFAEAALACDQVIALGAYQIEANYFANFKVHNEGSLENIFVIAYHPQLTDEHFYWQNLTLNSASSATFNLAGVPWDGFVLQPDFFTKYSENDIRRNAFLFGQQNDIKGDPIVIDGEPFIYSPTIQNYNSRGEWEGARCAKYEYQEELSYDVVDMENDFVLFRYADVLYTKLEALHRLGRAGEFIDDPDLQLIRTRAGLTPYAVGDLTDSELLDELGREFAWEGHRRQDQIRFGVWGNSWWEKPASGTAKKLFPIPQSAINTNPNLTQNPD